MDFCHVDISEFTENPKSLKRTFFKEEPLDLCCEWDQCGEKYAAFGDFENHMDIHVKVVIQFVQTEGVLIGCCCHVQELNPQE